MIYSSSDIEQNILKLVILDHFLPFYPLKKPKIKILKNEKVCWRYHHFTHVHWKSQSYDKWFLQYGVWQTDFFVIMDRFLPSPIILHMCTKNYDQMMYSSWDMLRNRQMDRWMDRQKKWHVEVGAPPKKHHHQDIFTFSIINEDRKIINRKF